eukprot:2641324-Rhodomonas_salina.1
MQPKPILQWGHAKEDGKLIAMEGGRMEGRQQMHSSREGGRDGGNEAGDLEVKMKGYLTCYSLMSRQCSLRLDRDQGVPVLLEHNQDSGKPDKASDKANLQSDSPSAGAVCDLYPSDVTECIGHGLKWRGGEWCGTST